MPSLQPRALIVDGDTDWALGKSYERAFVALGWTVRIWDPAKALSRQALGGRAGHLFSQFVMVEPWLRKANLELIRLAADWRPSLVIVISTRGVRAASLAQLRVLVPGSLLYCVYPDTPHHVDLERALSFAVFHRIFAGSPDWVSAFHLLGARRAEYLPFAADPAMHRPAHDLLAAGATHDVAFVGTWRSERETLLEGLADMDLIIWGSKYWRTRTRPGSPLKKLWGGSEKTGSAFAEVCAQSKVMLNTFDPVGWPGPNMRCFEQPACLAFSLVERTPAVLQIFSEGDTIACFSTIGEAKEQLAFYLENDKERSRIAKASYEFVVHGGHTYLDRARLLLERAQEDGLPFGELKRD